MHSAVDAGRNLQMQVADGRQLDEAVAHLEAAYRADPAYTTTQQGAGSGLHLGGPPGSGRGPVTRCACEIVEELNVWGWWWGTQGESEWAANAYRVSLLLRLEQPAIREVLAAMQAD